jgi:hypothetical protein
MTEIRSAVALVPPLAHSRAGTVYLVLDDFGGLGRRKPT